ncbi:MAG: hypothetical protein HQL69_20460 [Magnetococcales bacterium]|nr:hypothetical protein [Magnetococcales bacterium]
MPLVRQVKLPSFDSVNLNSTATLALPIGQTYHYIGIVFGGTGMTVAKMTGIRLKINGQIVQDWTGTQLNLMNQFNGRADAATKSILFLDFERYNLNTRQGRELTLLRTGVASKNASFPSVQTATLEIDVSDPTSVTLSAYAAVSGPQAPSLVKRVRRFGHSAASSGDYQIADLPKGDVIDQIGLSSTVILETKLKIDDYTIFDRTANVNNAVQLDGIRTPQSNLFVVDPSEAGFGDDYIATVTRAGHMVGDLRLTPNVSGAGDIDVIYQTIGAAGS